MHPLRENWMRNEWWRRQEQIVAASEQELDLLVASPPHCAVLGVNRFFLRETGAPRWFMLSGGGPVAVFQQAPGQGPGLEQPPHKSQHEDLREDPHL